MLPVSTPVTTLMLVVVLRPIIAADGDALARNHTLPAGFPGPALETGAICILAVKSLPGAGIVNYGLKMSHSYALKVRHFKTGF